MTALTANARRYVDDRLIRPGIAEAPYDTSIRLGVAALVALASQRSTDLIGSGSGPLAAQVGGLQLAFFVAAGVALVASLVAAVGLPGKTREGPRVGPAAEVAA